MDAWALRRSVYSHLAATGRAPDRTVLARWVAADGGDPSTVDALLRELAERHALVLDARGEIRMALPFSATPTDNRVAAADGSWWANCAWDALAIPAALGIDAAIDARWLDTGEDVGLAVRDGELTHTTGFVHFVVPAAHWWDDIVET
jgi:hypothetical protein